MDTQADHDELKAMFLAYQAQTDTTISTLTQAFATYKAESEVRSDDACVAVYAHVAQSTIARLTEHVEMLMQVCLVAWGAHHLTHTAV